MSKENDLDLNYRKFCVKIEGGPSAGGNPCIYFNKGFNFNQFVKWMWYFKYRAALYTVQNPYHSVEILTTSYEYVPPKEETIKRLQYKIIGAKREITKCNNALRLAKENWSELFPIENEDIWKKVSIKLYSYQCSLKSLQTELSNILIQNN